MTLRPYGIVIDGDIEFGLEVEVAPTGEITSLRPHTGIPDDYILSPAFVNAHSHLEYRGLMGKLTGGDFVEWIGQIAQTKRFQSLDDVRADCLTAARENVRGGVALIWEHADREGSAEAMRLTGLLGHVFQEVITLGEADGGFEKLEQIRDRALDAARSGASVSVNPHALYTVDVPVLRELADEELISLHFCESPEERAFVQSGTGKFAERFSAMGIEVTATGMTPWELVKETGLAKEGNQFVHCCDVTPQEIEQMAATKITVAHCPRSNIELGCPPAPVREMLDAGIRVGLGLDSAASSGPVDMFAEMRAALATSYARGRPLTDREVWSMATTRGAESCQEPGWEIAVGARTPLIGIYLPGAMSVDELIEQGKPEDVFWPTEPDSES